MTRCGLSLNLKNFVMSKPKPPVIPLPSGPTLTAVRLCEITTLSDRRHRQLAVSGYFPPPIRGIYQAGPTLLGIIKYQREQLAKKSDVLRIEQEAFTKAKRELAQEELAHFRG